MKVNIKEESVAFKPITVEFVLETEDDLLALWDRLAQLDDETIDNVERETGRKIKVDFDVAIEVLNKKVLELKLAK